MPISGTGPSALYNDVQMQPATFSYIVVL